MEKTFLCITILRVFFGRIQAVACSLLRKENALLVWASSGSRSPRRPPQCAAPVQAGGSGTWQQHPAPPAPPPPPRIAPLPNDAGCWGRKPLPAFIYERCVLIGGLTARGALWAGSLARSNGQRDQKLWNKQGEETHPARGGGRCLGWRSSPAGQGGCPG